MNKSPRVLLVSSRRDLEAPLKAGLQVLKASVVQAQSALEARRTLAQNAPFELVITDVRLTDGNWYSVLADLVESGSEANLLVVSAREDSGFARRVEEHGAMYFRAKDQDLATSVRALQGACPSGRETRLTATAAGTA